MACFGKSLVATLPKLQNTHSLPRSYIRKESLLHDHLLLWFIRSSLTTTTLTALVERTGPRHHYDMFHCLCPDHYTVTYGGLAQLDTGERALGIMYKNNVDIGEEGLWFCSYSGTGLTSDQGSRTIVSILCSLLTAGDTPGGGGTPCTCTLRSPWLK